MDTDVIRIYEKLCNKYPVELSSSWQQGYLSGIDYPILTGTSVLGSFEMSCDDVPSFGFYATRNNGECLVHWHLKTAEETEKAIIDFMEGKLTVLSFGQYHNI